MQDKKLAILAIIAMLLTIGGVWFQNRAVPPGKATWEDVLAEGRAGGYKIITSDELAERYRKDPGSLLLVDARQDWEYRTGHMKGSVNFPMEPTWWARWRNASALEAFLGPNKDRTIIFY